MNLTARQWELVLRGLVHQRDRIIDTLNNQAKAPAADAWNTMVWTWTRTRDDCQQAINEITHDHPEAVKLYYDSDFDGHSPLEQNF